MNEAFFRGVNNGLQKKAWLIQLPDGSYQDYDAVGTDVYTDASRTMGSKTEEQARKDRAAMELYAERHPDRVYDQNMNRVPNRRPTTWDFAKGRVIGTTAGGALGALAGNNLRNKILLGLLGGGTGYLAGDYYDRGDNSIVGQGLSKLFSLIQSNKDKSDKAKLLAANRNK